MDAKIGVRLDAADENRMVGGYGILALADRRSVGDAADLLHLHRRSDLNAHGIFGNAHAGEDFLLSIDGCAAVAAHRRNDVWLHAGGLEVVRGRAHDAGKVGDAAAAGADGDRIARQHRRHDATLGQGFAHGRVDIVDLGRVKRLVDGQQRFRQCGRETDILDIFKQVHMLSPSGSLNCCSPVSKRPKAKSQQRADHVIERWTLTGPVHRERMFNELHHRYMSAVKGGVAPKEAIVHDPPYGWKSCS